MANGEIFSLESTVESVPLLMYGISLGADLCIVLSGGDKPHIGAVTLSQAHPSLKGDGTVSSTSSVIAIPKHKEGELLQKISDEAARRINCNVVVCGGIHVADATSQLIELICAEAQNMLQRLLTLYSQKRGEKIS